ncbi:MAG: hypothetical protein JW801_07215 [Bacteroidales bacterium]|nr:hypothetical protein [Bacteroidales bacterium]
MRKLFFPVFLLMVALGTSAAQDSTSGKKVYASEDEKLYIHKDLGIFLWISTSPDPSSEKIRLRSESTRAYTNPMYLDTEGYNTIRSPSAVNPNTKQIVYPERDIIFEVYSDGYPPKTSSKYSYDAVRTMNGKTFYGGALSISLKSTDRMSGVDSIHYALNSNSYSLYREPIIITKDGENKISFFGTDHVGNNEVVREERFYLDRTPPSTSYSISGKQSGQSVPADALITLTSKDETSGVKAIYYAINNGPVKVYTTPIPAKLLFSEDSSLSYFAVDMLNNKETVKTIDNLLELKVE